MKTYEKITIYKVMNDVDTICFYGYTTTPLPAQFSSLKHEADNAKHRTPILDHMSKLGKDHFTMSHVETLSSVILDEVKTRIAEYRAQANRAHQATEPRTEVSHPQEAQTEVKTDAEPHHSQAQEAEAEHQQQDAQTEAEVATEPRTNAQAEAEQRVEPQI